MLFKLFYTKCPVREYFYIFAYFLIRIARSVNFFIFPCRFTFFVFTGKFTLLFVVNKPQHRVYPSIKMHEFLINYLHSKSLIQFK